MPGKGTKGRLTLQQKICESGILSTSWNYITTEEMIFSPGISCCNTATEFNRRIPKDSSAAPGMGKSLLLVWLCASPTDYMFLHADIALQRLERHT
ncbi:hypothetical protein SAMN04487941_3615 [Pontibacter akesuensis]|uniref:Uncharacterized protein n=1 Tax=Pontibacter akesuensis TaxID=388950 RepID=A0A1I7KDY5_9BACT|nr:hypothetical protein SAMN04487941_3615 [Pontibacter akesuensis]